MTKTRAIILCNDRRIDRRVLDQARSVALGNFDITVIAGPVPVNPDDLSEKAYPEFEVVRIDTKRSETITPTLDIERLKLALQSLPPFQWQQIFPDFIHFLAEAASRPAPLYVACDLPMLPAALMAAAYHGAKVLYDSHEFYPEQFPDPERVKLYHDIEAGLLPLVTKVVTVNESIAQAIAEFYNIKTPEVLLNLPGITSSGGAVVRTRLLRDAFSIPDDRKILLYQGNISCKVRNLERLAEAVCKLQRDDFVMIFMGDDCGALGDIAQIAEQYGAVGRKIFYHPTVPQQHLLRFTSSADAGVIPYIAVDINSKFCTPNKLFEFIVAGLAILASDLPELRRFVSGNDIGQNCELGSVEQIMEALNRFLDSDINGYRAKTAQIGKNYVWEAQSEKVLSIYNATLAGEA